MFRSSFGAISQFHFDFVDTGVLALGKGNNLDGILLTCSRGYMKDMVQAIFDAGEEFDLSPAGEGKFNNWIARLTK